jgi:hypothetical protein
MTNWAANCAKAQRRDPGREEVGPFGFGYRLVYDYEGISSEFFSVDFRERMFHTVYAGELWKGHSIKDYGVVQLAISTIAKAQSFCNECGALWAATLRLVWSGDSGWCEVLVTNAHGPSRRGGKEKREKAKTIPSSSPKDSMSQTLDARSQTLDAVAERRVSP